MNSGSFLFCRALRWQKQAHHMSDVSVVPPVLPPRTCNFLFPGRLGANCVGDSGASALAGALAVNTTLAYVE